MDLQGSDKIMKSLKRTVSMLSKFPSAASVTDAISLVRQKELMRCLTSDFYFQTFSPVKAILACLAILLDVCPSLVIEFMRRWSGDVRGIQSAKGTISNCDVLIDLLEPIEHFLNRLNIYTLVPATSAMNEIVDKILVELVSILALVTKKLKQRQSSESVLADVLLCSPPRSQFCNEFFQGEGHQGSPGETRPTDARRGPDYCSSYAHYCPRTRPEYEGVHGW